MGGWSRFGCQTRTDFPYQINGKTLYRWLEISQVSHCSLTGINCIEVNLPPRPFVSVKERSNLI